MLSLALSNQDLVTIGFVVGMSALAWVLMRLQARKKRPGTNRDFTPTTTGIPRFGDVRAMSDELNKLVVELQETSRKVAGQIDSRFQKLDVLLNEADAKIKRLEELKAELARAGMSQRSDALPALRSETRTRTEDPKYRPIYDLADQGKTAREIAQIVGSQPGEVELILALRGK